MPASIGTSLPHPPGAGRLQTSVRPEAAAEDAPAVKMTVQFLPTVRNHRFRHRPQGPFARTTQPRKPTTAEPSDPTSLPFPVRDAQQAEFAPKMAFPILLRASPFGMGCHNLLNSNGPARIVRTRDLRRMPDGLQFERFT